MDRDRITLENYVNNSVVTLSRKIGKVTNLFHDTLLYSSKTYFLDVVNRQTKEIDDLNKKINILQAKNEIYSRQLEQALVSGSKA